MTLLFNDRCDAQGRTSDGSGLGHAPEETGLSAATEPNAVDPALPEAAAPPAGAEADTDFSPNLITLAKRIEAAQEALRAGLCRIPLIVGLVGQWGEEVIAGRVPLAEFVDLSTPIELPGAQLPSLGDAAEETGPEAPASRSAGQMLIFGPRLERLSALAQEIGALSQKNLAALERGRDLTKPARSRLQKLLTTFAGEMAALQLHPDRVSALVGEL